MKINFDYHTHTTYSHGKGSIEDNAVAAKEAGLKGIAITDHGFAHPAFGMRRRKLDRMKKECIEAEQKTGVKVLLGIESNILGESGKTDVTPSDYEKLDVFLAGVHRFIWYDTPKDFWRLLVRNFLTSQLHIKPSQSQIKYNTRCYINAIKNNPIDIITHVNYLVYADVVEVAKCCADYGTYIEINTKKVHLSDDEWRKVIDTGVNFVVDSDAHSPQRVGDTALFENLLERVEIPENRIFNIGERTTTMRFAEFKKKL